MAKEKAANMFDGRLSNLFMKMIGTKAPVGLFQLGKEMFNAQRGGFHESR
jgi:hypothetical protein